MDLKGKTVTRLQREQGNSVGDANTAVTFLTIQRATIKNRA